MLFGFLQELTLLDVWEISCVNGTQNCVQNLDFTLGPFTYSNPVFVKIM
jgi:hypothetical protein